MVRPRRRRRAASRRVAVAARAGHPADHARRRARRSPATPSAPASCVDSSRHLNRVARRRPRGADRAVVQPGTVHATLQRAAAAARAAVRPRPVDAHPLHDRRDDRQQRLRLARARLRPHRRQRRSASTCSPAAGERLRLGATPAGRVRRCVDRARRPGRRRTSATIRTELGRFAPPGVRLRARAPAARERPATSPGPWSAPRAPSRSCSARPSGWWRTPPRRALVVLGYPTMFEAADAVPGLLAPPAGGLRGPRRPHRRRGARGTAARGRCPDLPRGARLAVRRRSPGDDAGRGRGSGRAAVARDAGARRRAAGHRRRRRWRRCGGSARTAPASPPARRRAAGAGRLGGRRRAARSGSAPTCASSTRCSTDARSGRACPTGTSATAACTSASTSRCGRTGGRARVPGVRRGGRGPGRRRTAAALSGRARRRPGPLRAAAADVLRRGAGPVRGGQARSSTPTTCSTPGVLVDAAAGRRRPAARRPAARAAARPCGCVARRRLGRRGGAPLHRVGKCLADNTGAGGVMCPSYLATRDEKDSTRGRARVLQEMVNGGSSSDGWRSDEVHEALDLCLSCKGCASDCPTGVDMATYKAEVLHQRYRRRLRPRSHYALGQLPRWARLASPAPRLANRLLTAPGRRSGWPRRRRASTSAAACRPSTRRPFRRWAGRAVRRSRRPRPTTWCCGSTRSPTASPPAPAGPRSRCSRRRACGSAWSPSRPAAGSPGSAPASSTPPGASSAGRSRCCTRTSTRGVPVVGLEPSCLATLRSDAVELSDDPRAADGRGRRALARRGAHRPATAGSRPTCAGTRSSRSRTATTPACSAGTPTRRCSPAPAPRSRGSAAAAGWPGNFGVEQGHYEVSVAVAEHDLLPAVRAAGDGRRRARGRVLLPHPARRPGRRTSGAPRRAAWLGIR